MWRSRAGMALALLCQQLEMPKCLWKNSWELQKHGIQHAQRQDEPSSTEMIPFGGSFKGLVSGRGSSGSCSVGEPPAPAHCVKILLFPTEKLGIRGSLPLGRVFFMLRGFFGVLRWGFAGSRGWDDTGKVLRVISIPAKQKHRSGELRSVPRHSRQNRDQLLSKIGISSSLK